MIKKVVSLSLMFILGILPQMGLSEAGGAVSMSNSPSETAIFAMGCFWCGEAVFRDEKLHKPLPGIITVEVGYAGGDIPSPTYASHEGYQEAVKVVFDPRKISYQQILTLFWHNVDPFDAFGQFCDKGDSYRAVIFYSSETQKDLAESAKQKIQKEKNKTVATEILPLTTFYEAEDYHQNYEANNPIRYRYYRWRCGRDARLNAIWP